MPDYRVTYTRINEGDDPSLCIATTKASTPEKADIEARRHFTDAELADTTVSIVELDEDGEPVE